MAWFSSYLNSVKNSPKSVKLIITFLFIGLCALCFYSILSSQYTNVNDGEKPSGVAHVRPEYTNTSRYRTRINAEIDRLNWEFKQIKIADTGHKECVISSNSTNCECDEHYTAVNSTHCVHYCELCSQNCIFQQNRFKCECQDGYRFAMNSETKCKAINGSSGYLYLMSRINESYKVPLNQDETNDPSDYFGLSEVFRVENYFNFTNGVTKLEFLYKTNEMFYIVQEIDNYFFKVLSSTLYKTRIDNQHNATLLFEASDFTIDWIYDHIYWIDWWVS